MAKPGFSILAYALLIIAFLLISCSTPSDVTVIPEVAVTSAPRTPSPASAPPTATQSRTPEVSPTPLPIDVIHTDYTKEAKYKDLGTNPHAFGLSGEALTKWRSLRAELDAKYEKAWEQILFETTKYNKWQAEYLTFFGAASVPDISKWDSLTNQQKMDMVAAYLRVYGDGVTAVNVPTSWMREAASSRELLFVRYDASGGFPKIGYLGAASPPHSSEYYDEAPEFSSFGTLAKLQWRARFMKLGIFANDYINSVNYPDKPISYLGFAWVYVCDQQGGKHATFGLFPFAQQSIINGGQYVHPQDTGGESVISPATSNITTAPVVLELLSRSETEKTTITPESSDRVWRMFVYARKQSGLTWIFNNGGTTSSMFLFFDIDTQLSLIAPSGFVFPPHP